MFLRFTLQVYELVAEDVMSAAKMISGRRVIVEDYLWPRMLQLLCLVQPGACFCSITYHHVKWAEDIGLVETVLR